MTLSAEKTSGSQMDLGSIVENEVSAKNPLLLVSAPGYDASYIVD